MNEKIISKVFWILSKKSFQKQIANIYNNSFAKTTMKKAKIYYNNIFQNAPMIGNRNPKLVDILFTAFVTAIYKASDKKISITQMDSIMTKGLESVYVFRKSVEKKNHFSKSWQDKHHSQALFTQQKKYTDDFICEFIYGKTLDEYGINYYECAIYKLLNREGCSELTPLFCKFDYVMAKHMNATLKRTKTLVTGGDCCDFWYTKN